MERVFHPENSSMRCAGWEDSLRSRAAFAMLEINRNRLRDKNLNPEEMAT